MTSNDTDLKYWIGFLKISGIGRVRITQLLNYFGSLKNAWDSSISDLIQSGLDSKTSNIVITSRPKINPDEEIEKLQKYKVQAIPYLSKDYPARLLEISDYPPVLFVRGSLLPEDENCLSVVGTRKISMYGRQVTEDFTSDLSRNKITIVSGLAKGTDSVAHKCALENGGRTIAVFACGLDIVYPAENAGLAKAIIENGALISEYPLGTKPKPDNFPRRNRIMSGISLGVLVIEAGEKSGALITAQQAMEQNREVFAVPGSIYSPYSNGTNTLIQRSGAKLVRNYLDILEELNLAQVAQQLEMKELLPLDENEKLLIKQLSSDPVHVDEVCRMSGLPTSTVGATLTVLELKGFIKQTGSMNYVLSKGIK